MAECWSFTLVVTFVFDEAHNYNFADSTAFQLTFLFCWYLHFIYSFHSSALWYLHCSNRAPEFLLVWNNRQSVDTSDFFVYFFILFLLFVSFFACFHSELPLSLGSFSFHAINNVEVWVQGGMCCGHRRRTAEEG